MTVDGNGHLARESAQGAFFWVRVRGAHDGRLDDLSAHGDETADRRRASKRRNSASIAGTPSIRARVSAARKFQIERGPERLEIHPPVYPLEVIALRGQFPQTLLDVEQSCLPRQAPPPRPCRLSESSTRRKRTGFWKRPTLEYFESCGYDAD